MGWGNVTRTSDIALRKRHHAETAALHKRICDLEAHITRLLALVPHANACAYWRDQPCSCGAGL